MLWKKIFQSAALVIFLSYASNLFTPQFLVFSTRSRQSEAKTNLASIATAEIAYRAEVGTYGNSFDVIGWSPQGSTRYHYFLANGYDIDKYFPATTSVETSFSNWTFKNYFILAQGQSYLKYKKINKKFVSVDEAMKNLTIEYGIGPSPDDFTALAIGNVDEDPELDVWIVNKEIIPINLYNDNVVGYGAVLRKDYYLLEMYDDGFVFYLDRLSLPFFILNILGWFFMSVLEKKYRNRI